MLSVRSLLAVSNKESFYFPSSFDKYRDSMRLSSAVRDLLSFHFCRSDGAGSINILPGLPPLDCDEIVVHGGGMLKPVCPLY